MKDEGGSELMEGISIRGFETFASETNRGSEIYDTNVSIKL